MAVAIPLCPLSDPPTAHWPELMALRGVSCCVRCAT